MIQLARNYGLVCGILPTGKHNAITDVPGVTVGHHTLRAGEINTGVTAILPHDGNIFRRKLLAAAEVINGFGKSAGLVQLDELGTLETPILLTNTFGVGACFNALVDQAVAANPDIGRATSTVNPVVGECNDGPLNDIQARIVNEDHAHRALADATSEAARRGHVGQGNIGAGTGMTCFDFKGGIGTASRRLDLRNFDLGHQELSGTGSTEAKHTVRHLGVLVLTNFGCAGDLVLPDGSRPVPPVYAKEIGHAGAPAPQPEKGSVIIVLATDVPLEHRQLKRVLRRCGAGLARLGAFWGHGSGDIALGFTTAVTFDHDEPRATVPIRMLNEDRIDLLFRAAAEATQEAVLNSMCAAEALTGRAGNHRASLADWLRG